MKSSERQDTATITASHAPSPTGRSLVLVAGSGRSGTSLFTGILARLGFHVPQPEVVADVTNPRGFAESKWAVDFHIRLLKRAGVQVADARPAAWGETARVALDDQVRRELRQWLETQFREADHIIIKDPRLSWFLPLWRSCAADVGVSTRFASVLRHPAAVVDSKQRSYGNWQGDVDRTAGWINQMLFTERATREGPRAFVRYEELLDDWTRVIARVGKTLDLAVIRDAPAAAIVQVHDFVDGTSSRSRPSWDEFKIPAPLRDQADEVWELMSRLADEDAEAGSLTDSLEAARAAYVELYEDAEAIAQSSIVAARRRAPVRRSSLLWLVRRVPKRYRRRVPLRWRVTIARALQRGGAIGP
jgi:hypothetical protein